MWVIVDLYRSKQIQPMEENKKLEMIHEKYFPFHKTVISANALKSLEPSSILQKQAIKVKNLVVLV